MFPTRIEGLFRIESILSFVGSNEKRRLGQTHGYPVQHGRFFSWKTFDFVNLVVEGSSVVLDKKFDGQIFMTRKGCMRQSD